uniref:Trehalase n=1 Tax=Meloidogyne incognita TaxID=6306 RepID=A0A914MYL7_MELIC
MERNSSEQWDFPNGWAPQQHLFVISLLNCKNNEKAKNIANKIPAQMWEKYDVRFGDGQTGFGGEYPPQSGFGWSNGVVLEFIRMFYTKLGGN